MNKRSQKIINELLQENLISNESDLTANDKTNFVFDYMINKYSYLLKNEATSSSECVIAIISS